MFGSILVLASSVARAASKYHLLLRDPHFSVIAILVLSTVNQGGTLKGFISENPFSQVEDALLIKIIVKNNENIYSANFFADVQQYRSSNTCAYILDRTFYSRYSYTY